MKQQPLGLETGRLFLRPVAVGNTPVKAKNSG
jgi:hypothetical protein